MSKAGRPRAFCSEQALSKALDVFWEKGYEGASLADLTKAMGINAPSLYAAFGSKQGLYQCALELYTCSSANWLEEALDKPTIRESILSMITTYTKNLSETKSRGCMILLAAPQRTPENKELHDFLARHRKKNELGIRKRLKQAIDDSELPVDCDISSIATFYNAVLQGMSLQARNGASQKTLQSIADSSIKAWDGLIK